MMNLPAEPFFLDAEPGRRFCIYHPPHPERVCRGGFIYVHPFAEEMNRSRRMAALQARRFADLGYGVLLIDLLGCGDSSGDFGDASWDRWKADLAVAKQWLEARIAMPVGLWGLRLGALLALDFAQQPQQPGSDLAALVLWSPVISGKSFMTQFLRLRLGSDMLDAESATSKTSTTQTMRAAMQTGETLEIAGYPIAPALALTIDALEASAFAADLALRKTPVYWFDILRSGDSALPPATAAAIDAWRGQAVGVHLATVPGLPFWATPELSICPELLDATSALLP
jgi:exosortase A-associated hydrolase 2